MNSTPDNSDAELVQHVLRTLLSNERPGVGLLAPLGYQPRPILDAVVAELTRTDHSLLPVRVTPDFTSGPEWLYRQLTRSLRAHLWTPEAIDAELDGDQSDDVTPEQQFETTALAVHEAQGPGRRLLLVIDGLALAPVELLVDWSQSFQRLCQQGVRLLGSGGLELFRACGDGDATRADLHVFHWLAPIVMPPLTVPQIDIRSGAFPGTTSSLSQILFDMTGGHPPLVDQVLAKGRHLLLNAGMHIRDIVLQTSHMDQVHHQLRTKAWMRQAARRLSRVAPFGTPIPRNPGDLAERDLEWLGLVIRTSDGWRWGGMAMAHLACY